MKTGAPRKGEEPPRVAMLEDALWMASTGATDDEIMARQGYTNRESWHRSMTRAGLPKLPKQKTNVKLSLAERARGYVFTPAPIVHGTATGYGWHACRCEECREWNRKHAARRRAARFAAAMPAHVEHGTRNGYANYGCRCEECRGAWNAYQRDLYWARKARG